MQQANQNIYDKLIFACKSNKFYVDINNNVFIEKVIDDIVHQKPEPIKIILSDEVLKKAFFQEIEGALIFKPKELIEALTANLTYLNSRTTYNGSIGLAKRGDFIKKHNDVILEFPFKDTVFAGGQEKDDQKSKENFLHGIINANEIARLLEPKVMTNIKRYSKDRTETNPTITENDNLIIKGNNLLALHSLLDKADGTPLYRGKVKLIYIDPPYNTGNDSFGYNDNFSHSTWLTFMKNRLEIAREFLRDDGVIFVQCDDNEQAYLKVLMDEIFGRENIICDFIWQKKTGASDAKNIAIITEYSLCYAKNNQPNLFSKNTESYDFNRYKLSDKHVEIRGNYYIDNLDRGGLSYSDSLNYGIVCPDGSITYPNGRREYKNDGWIWKWGKEKVEWALENDFLEFRKSNTKESGWAVCYKNYLLVDNKNKSIVRAAPYKNLILDVLNNDAANEMKALFGEKIFSYPKPEKLIQRFIAISTQPNDLVLDYHLGSGTTAAVAHKMGRQYIGIEQMSYIEDIAVERLKKVIEGEQGGISKSVEWQGGGEFVYMELKKIDDFEDTILEKEMYYLPTEEIEDEQYGISEEEKRVNYAFYGIDTMRKNDE